MIQITLEGAKDLPGVVYPRAGRPWRGPERLPADPAAGLGRHGAVDGAEHQHAGGQRNHRQLPELDTKVIPSRRDLVLVIAGRLARDPRWPPRVLGRRRRAHRSAAACEEALERRRRQSHGWSLDFGSSLASTFVER